MRTVVCFKLYETKDVSKALKSFILALGQWEQERYLGAPTPSLSLALQCHRDSGGTVTLLGKWANELELGLEVARPTLPNNTFAVEHFSCAGSVRIAGRKTFVNFLLRIPSN